VVVVEVPSEGRGAWRNSSWLVVTLGKALNDIISTFEWLDCRNRWQLDSKTVKVALLSPELNK